MNNFAISLRSQGKYGDAERVYREALAGQRKALGVAHPSTLASMTNLASLLQQQGERLVLRLFVVTSSAPLDNVLK